MKLVEILAEELKEWPEGYTRIVQTNKEITLPIDNTDVGYSLNQWDYYIASTRIYDAECETSELADDYQTAIVTKEMWEAEKAKLNAQNTTIEAESFNPIYCRDRIKEIDALVESLEEERVSLVQALKDEGFVLISTALINAAPVEDMSDWKNWKEGDLVVIKVENAGQYGDRFTVGGKYEVTELDLEDTECPLQVKGLWFRYCEVHQMEWHSRPVKEATTLTNMNSWRNWKAWDVVECIESHGDQFTKGSLYILSENPVLNSLSLVADDNGNPNGWTAWYFKFHSRP